MSSLEPHWNVDDLQDVCLQFQLDLSCMVDDELDEAAAHRAAAHLERCEGCREFFDDIRDQVRAHNELASPDLLIAKYTNLVGRPFENELETIELVNRLASIFYQLGKAYVLSGANPCFRIQVFEKTCPVEETRNRGRGFVDGMLQRGRGTVGGLDLTSARNVFDTHTPRMESHAERGRRLLQECLAVDSTHEEARLYLAYQDMVDGKRIRAANGFRRVFNGAVNDENRAHAAIQLGRVYCEEGEFKKALACCRWVISQGFADQDERFFVARFNAAMYWARLGEPSRSIAAFRELLDANADSLPQIQKMFANAPTLHNAIKVQPGFTEALAEVCPELVEMPEEDPSSAGELEEKR